VTTRRLIAVILGMLGVVVMLDVAVIAIANPETTDFTGFRHVMLFIIGGLLILSGTLTFSWPRKSVGTSVDVEQQHHGRGHAEDGHDHSDHRPDAGAVGSQDH